MNLKKRIKVLAAVFALLLAASCSGVGDSPSGEPTGEQTGGQAGEQTGTQGGGTLNLFTWEGMFPQEFMNSFEKDTGIKINYVNFDSDETMLTKLEAAGGGDYDLIFADDYIIETVIAKGLAQKWDQSKLTNRANINPLYQGQFYDPTDEYTVPHGAGIQTIVYNPATSPIAITCYADLWDASLKDSVGIIGHHRVINGMALKVLGKSYNTDDLGDINAAGEKLIELAPNIRLIKDDSIQNDFLAGEISAAVMYTSQVTQVMLEDSSFEVVFPTEGIGFGIIAAFVPSNAPNAGAAHAFINYLLDAERSARCFEWLGYYCTNKAADPLIEPEFRPFLTLPENFGGGMEMIQNISAEAEEVHMDVWTKFKQQTE